VTLSVGTITGGLSVNTVADRCTIEIDRRVLPGEEPMGAFQQVVDFVNKYRGIDFVVEHDEPYLKGIPLADDVNGPLADKLVKVVRELYGVGDKVGVPYGTDASKIARCGVPSVVFGPGSIAQAHTADEWLSIEELTKASEVLYQFGKRGM
jgi:acetylornithine deacetylase